jgi:Holliday junction resolvasome RuvABC endonuclease subunit
MTGSEEGTGPAITITGLDLSLTSTGIARLRPGHTPEVATLTPGNRTGHKRLAWLLAAITYRTAKADLVTIEGPSYGSTTGNQHERAGLWWLVAHHLWAAGIPYVVIAPAQLKRYAAGKGNAAKDQVLAAVIRRYSGVPVSGHDQADALILAAMAADHYGRPIAPVPQANRAALTTVRNWPPLGTGVSP